MILHRPARRLDAAVDHAHQLHARNPLEPGQVALARDASRPDDADAYPPRLVAHVTPYHALKEVDGAVLFPSSELVLLSRSILEAVGTPEDLASVVAASLVDANLAGHDSHGVIRLNSYVANVRSGQVQPAARAQVQSLGGACARVDGGWGWGQPAAHVAIDAAASLARANGVGLVAIGHCNHIGRLGEYVEKLGRAGLMGLMTCNARAAVAPYGGYTRLLGTNPIAWGTPRDLGEPPLVVDFATAAIAEGKLRVAHAAGSRAPRGAVVDKAGHPSEETAAFYDGGALTTFGGHKGFGLSVMAELMGGVLSGTGASSSPGYDNGNGTLVMAIEVGRFLPAGDFSRQVAEFAGLMHAAPKAPGFDEILLPGEPEWRARRQRSEEGIPVPAAIHRAIVDLATELGVTTR
jgi:LDH2 family malate/lactate/ureidoglycolate dehydrogenase